MSPSAFDESDLHVPTSPSSLRKMSSISSVQNGNENSLAIPGSEDTGPIEVPATRSAISEASKYMHNLSVSPSMRDRRSSRNSFGTALPIPRKRQSRLSSVHHADGRPARPGMPPIQPTRELLVSQVQSIQAEKVKKAKNMAFAFDIDGVLVHGDRLIPEGRKALEILNGDNELGIKIPPHLPHQRIWKDREGPLRAAVQDPPEPRQHRPVHPVPHTHECSGRVLQHCPCRRW
ncbi:hypothetical protein FSOLCH5_006724 [Fusarium solani]